MQYTATCERCHKTVSARLTPKTRQVVLIRHACISHRFRTRGKAIESTLKEKPM